MTNPLLGILYEKLDLDPSCVKNSTKQTLKELCIKFVEFQLHAHLVDAFDAVIASISKEQVEAMCGNNFGRVLYSPLIN